MNVDAKRIEANITFAMIKNIVAFLFHILDNRLVFDRDGLEALQFNTIQARQAFYCARYVGYFI
jgi:hypothetical protein